MIEPGRLDTAVDFKKLTVAQDAYGSAIETYTTDATAPTKSQFIPLRGSEAVEARKITAKRMFKLRIRRWTGITLTHVAVVLGMTADITAVEDNHRAGDMVVWCEARE